MKKTISILIVFSFLFISNKTYAVFVGGSPSQNCQANGGIYQNNDCRYACEIGTSISYFSSKDSIGYKQCLEEKEKLALELKQKTLNERKEVLSSYSDYFDKVGVNLTIDTDEEQYNQWKKELKEARNEYFKEQENNQKIEDLENRIKELESKPIITEKIIIPTETTKNKEEIIKPIVTENKPIKKEVVKEETKIETQKDNKEIQITQNSDTTKTTITETPKTSVFKRVFGWFKSLF